LVLTSLVNQARTTLRIQYNRGMEKHGRLAAIWTTWRSPGATPKYKVLFFDDALDGNPQERFRVGEDGLRYCLESEYGVEPSTVDSIFRELARNGEADITI